MKKLISILLLCVCMVSILSGCSTETESASPTAEPTQQVNFAPQTTAVVTSSLAQALASVGGGDAATVEENANDSAEEPAQDQPAAVDTPAEADDSEPDAAAEAPAEPEITPEPVKVEAEAPAVEREPYATATPQPNASISGYSSITAPHLMFKFNYPQGWNNIPGKSTVCYIQPVENGTVYPARVSVSMKEIDHNGTEERLQEQFKDFFEVLMSQYDESTFEADENLNTGTGFMGGRRSIATTYLAYDGDQEIKGYVAMTYFEKYVFCYHFRCAFVDYEALESAVHIMRDSVSPYQEEKSED